METSRLIAKILGIIYLSFGIGLLFNSKYYKNELPKLVQNSAYLILVGLFAIVIGVLIIENHNYWAINWTVIITIFGWIALLKGIMLLAFPSYSKMFQPMFKSSVFYVILGPLVILFGLILMYFGYFK